MIDVVLDATIKALQRWQNTRYLKRVLPGLSLMWNGGKDVH